MKFAIAAAALAVAAVASPSFAADKANDVSWYGNIGYTNQQFSDANLGEATVRIGGRGTYFGVEAEASTGLTSKSVGGASVKINDQYGVYAVGFMPIEGSNTDLFARVGYAQTDYKVSGGGSSVTGGNGNWAAGFGGQWFYKGGKDGVRADYTYMSQSGSTHVNLWGLSYVHKF
jgi:hypothetical protein